MLQPLKNNFWHPAIAYLAALWHGFPARDMTVIGVTGTKGKSTTAEMLFAILRAAGHRTALASTIRFAIAEESEPNRFKMTMPGRGYVQGFLARARRRGATHAIVEITSEGARQHRHDFLFLDGLIVTNIHKEHIESHGSFENYVAAKRAIVGVLERSPKKKVLVVNGDNEHTKNFLDADVIVKLTFAGATTPGDFNAANARAATTLAVAFGIPKAAAEGAIAAMPQVRGRVEPINLGQPFQVIVDYAHTPDSLEALYGAFPGPKICVLGNTGGGRDQWKRPEMGRIADEACDTVILTNEDPYDEGPRAIVEAMAAGMARAPEIIMDRREAIREALRLASLAQGADKNVTVLISGKGTDPYLMEAHGKRTPWDDAAVAKEELILLLEKS